MISATRSNARSQAGLGDDLAPGLAGLLDGREHLFARLIGGIGRGLELLAAVAPLDGHTERPQPGVDEPGRPADLGEHLVAHLGRRAGAVGVFPWPGTAPATGRATASAAICGSGSSGSTPARLAIACAATSTSRSIMSRWAARSAGVRSNSS
jgi:hypothetical protein